MSLFGFFFRFYSHNSSFVHGGVEKPGEEQPPVMGQAVSVSWVSLKISHLLINNIGPEKPSLICNSFSKQYNKFITR